MIRFANRLDIPVLKALWHEAFGDDDSFINFFYENRFTEGNTLVWVENEAPVAMLTLLSAQMRVSGKLYPVSYVYGVATKREYRGRGISSKLMRYINERADTTHEILVLVPAQKSLFDFYSKFGYKTSFCLKEVTFPAQPLLSSNYEITPVSACEYKEIRDQHFQDNGYIIWDENALDYIIKENALSGGLTVKIEHDSSQDIVMYYRKDEALYIRETTLNNDALLSVLSDIALKAGCSAVHTRLSQSCELNVQATGFGMIYTKIALDIPNAYFNLFSD